MTAKLLKSWIISLVALASVGEGIVRLLTEHKLQDLLLVITDFFGKFSDDFLEFE